MTRQERPGQLSFDALLESEASVSAGVAGGAPAGQAPAVDELLEQWVMMGWLRSLDAHLAHFMAEREPAMAPLVQLSIALVSHQLGRGHVCLDLEQALTDADAVLSLPPQEGSATTSEEAAAIETPAHVLARLDVRSAGRWAEQLAASALIGDGRSPTPLVLKEQRLYLYRFWRCECDVARELGRRMAAPRPVDPAVLKPHLGRLFQRPETTEGSAAPDWQQLACVMALRQQLMVISGGPGTGKTTTVTRLLALLQESALGSSEQPLAIRLVAPTGKAAARLTESIGRAIDRLELGPDIRRALPREATTLHRLLGARPDSRHFRHDRQQPLSLDLLVVDEASMVDLELMTALLAALPEQAQLILLGDKDQLASVEAGAVLGDLCQGAEQIGYSDALIEYLQAMTDTRVEREVSPPRHDPMRDHVVVLRQSYRFDAGSGIGQLAGRINAGDTAGVRRLWSAGFDDIDWQRLSGVEDRQLIGMMLSGYRDYLKRMWQGAEPLEVLDAFARFQVLCALRRGPWGIEGLNERIAAALQREGLIAATSGWYAGLPVMITRNDPQLALYNGDIGITLPDPEAGGRLRVFFEIADEQAGRRARAVLPGRLDSVETAWAMTVHKSQGSEFERILFVLPDRPNPILTRELVYTAVTRARDYCCVVSAFDEALVYATARRVHRASHIRERLQTIAGVVQ
ncbi:DNA helicase/exodeoxyribonuclease V alpha subunit [Kushneria sinocarnis]|uniref:RecBCD enzyme subunit RecD n=1 Tax=Kushneria sinocarnis TaxID=595502 RepID=A0A420WV20_9GAMM|nr:exodeoxyribonuclease V subunit alpha [Kushneria sinocarnis]RKR02421.1 DNA helicase/exodeoxyribonuclease V alpha subunit [Kushneria sinocarnis]